jgi:hypothetical protein
VIRAYLSAAAQLLLQAAAIWAAIGIIAAALAAGGVP